MHATPPFRPLVTVDGYLPIGDHGLVGDGTTAALVGRDATVSWLCAPRFDGEAVFCALLDAERGGAARLSVDGLVESRQWYEPDTLVLVTELRSRTGVLRVTDCLPLRAGADLRVMAAAGRGELVRHLAAVEGEVRVEVAVEPRDGGPELRVAATRPLDGPRGVLDLAAGDEAGLVLRWEAGEPDPVGAGAAIRETGHAWRRWAATIRYDGPQRDLVRRSVLTLKALDHFASGGMVAAATSSLPELVGGTRNWDYRFAWVRDAAFAVYALRRVGMADEASGFLRWLLDAVERDGRPRVLYTVDGCAPPPERADPGLRGYRGSAPVRWGNAAAEQVQHDAYGEILDCAWQWVSGGGALDALWPRLTALVEEARAVWDSPDHGVWEVRTPGRVFTYSAAMCQVALDRGARIAERLGLPCDAAWRAEAERVRAAVLDRAWDEEARTLTEHLGGGGVDASLLALPIRRVVDARHPRMVATVEAIVRRLGAGDGLLYRYLPEESPDGLPGHEGAFLLCSFWLVDNLAYQGRLDEAYALYDDLCGRAGPLGLLPEQVDPTTGDFLGNYPQAFSHVGVVSSGINLARLGGAAVSPLGGQPPTG